MFKPRQLLISAALLAAGPVQLWGANCTFQAFNPLTGQWNCKPPRVCSFRIGSDGQAALATNQIQPQLGICNFPQSGTLISVTVLADAGASTVQVGFRHAGVSTNLSPLLTPATVSGITDKVACANVGGVALVIQGTSVTCSALTNTALAAQDYAETTAGTADGTTKRLMVTLIWSE